MKSFVIYFLTFLGLTYSCSKISKNIEIDIDLSKYESSINLDQYSDSIRHIKLETTAECLISRIDMIIQDDSLLLILDKTNKSVYIFHSTGRFYRKIHHWGKGNGEYIYIKAIAIDKEKKVLFVYDDRLRKLISYDYSGGFLNEIDLPDYYIRSFEIRKNGNFLAFTPDNNSPLRDGVWEFDKNGQLVKAYSNVDRKNKLAWSVFPYCTKIDDSYSFLNYYDNYIYKITENKLDKQQRVNIKQKIPDKYLSSERGIGETFTDKYYMPGELNETRNFYHFENYSVVSEPKDIHVFIEKKSNSLIITDSLIYDFDIFRNIDKIFSNDGDNLFGVYETMNNNNPALIVFSLKSMI